MGFILEHTRIGFEIPEFAALVLLVALVVFFFVRSRQMKKREEELEKEIIEVQSSNKAFRDSMRDN